jgi:acetoin utilization protein AcuB
MVVRMWMRTGAATIAPEASITDAAIAMARGRLRHLLVVEQRASGTRALLGLVSSHDVARALPPDINPFSVDAWERRIDRPVSEIMTQKLLTVTPSTPIEEAARLLRDHRIGALPVVDASGLVGIITESDIFQAFLDVVGVDTAGVRVTFDISTDEDAMSAAVALAHRHGLRLASVLTVAHDDRRLGVVRLIGADAQPFVDSLWASGHRVLAVEQPAGTGRGPAPRSPGGRAPAGSRSGAPS